MSEPTTFNVESYFNEFADKGAMEEAARFRTLPSDTYTIQVRKYEGRKFEGDDQPVLHFTADVLGEDGRKRATVFFNASWVAKRDAETGEYNRNFKRWEQITRALFPDASAQERASKSVGEVLTALTQYPVKAYITESYQVPAIDGTTKWVTPRSKDEVITYKAAGYKSQNFVQSISKL